MFTCTFLLSKTKLKPKNHNSMLESIPRGKETTQNPTYTKRLVWGLEL